MRFLSLVASFIVTVVTKDTEGILPFHIQDLALHSLGLVGCF